MRMSKQILHGTPLGAPASPRAIRGRLACCLVLSLIICALILTPAQRVVSQESPATTAAARNAALMAATEEVLKETSSLRQLSVLRSVPSSALSRSEIERAVIKNLDEDTSAADMHAAEVTMKKLGLAPPDFQ